MEKCRSPHWSLRETIPSQWSRSCSETREMVSSHSRTESYLSWNWLCLIWSRQRRHPDCASWNRTIASCSLRWYRSESICRTHGLIFYALDPDFRIQNHCQTECEVADWVTVDSVCHPSLVVHLGSASSESGQHLRECDLNSSFDISAPYTQGNALCHSRSVSLMSPLSASYPGTDCLILVYSIEIIAIVLLVTLDPGSVQVLGFIVKSPSA